MIFSENTAEPKSPKNKDNNETTRNLQQSKRSSTIDWQKSPDPDADRMNGATWSTK